MIVLIMGLVHLSEKANNLSQGAGNAEQVTFKSLTLQPSSGRVSASHKGEDACTRVHHRVAPERMAAHARQHLMRRS